VTDDDVNRALHRAFADDLEHRADRVERYLRELGHTQDGARRDELSAALALEAHNLKGTALTLGLDEVTEVADGLEALATRIARGETRVAPDAAATVTAALRSFAAPSSDGAGVEPSRRPA
jgi:chemotaxis protein histidine kinase CheA